MDLGSRDYQTEKERNKFMEDLQGQMETVMTIQKEDPLGYLEWKWESYQRNL